MSSTCVDSLDIWCAMVHVDVPRQYSCPDQAFFADQAYLLLQSRFPNYTKTTKVGQYLHETAGSLAPVINDPQGRLLPTYPMLCYAMPCHPARTAHIVSPARVRDGGYLGTGREYLDDAHAA